MALHPNFPTDPHAILDPAIRWFPADEALREKRADQLMPPLVPMLRKEVKAWRDRGYEDATETSKSLLRWWFFESRSHQAASDANIRDERSSVSRAEEKRFQPHHRRRQPGTRIRQFS